MVIDGQQRLQTIYLAIYGSYDHKILYFDLLSGVEPDDISQAKYHFEYLTTVETELRNRQLAGIQYWIPLREIANFSMKMLAIKIIDYLRIANIVI